MILLTFSLYIHISKSYLFSVQNKLTVSTSCITQPNLNPNLNLAYLVWQTHLFCSKDYFLRPVYNLQVFKCQIRVQSIKTSYYAPWNWTQVKSERAVKSVANPLISTIIHCVFFLIRQTYLLVLKAYFDANMKPRVIDKRLSLFQIRIAHIPTVPVPQLVVTLYSYGQVYTAAQGVNILCWLLGTL